MTSIRLSTGHLIATTLIREKRRTLTMRFLNQVLVIKAPQRLSPEQIETFIRRKEAWILKAQAQSEQIRLEEDELFILNRKRQCVYVHASTFGYRLEPERLVISHPAKLSPQGARKKALEGLAESVIVPIYEDSLRLTGLKPAVMRLRALKSSWGRCSSKGVITLSRKLIECDPDFIRYVAVHELVHLVHLNHSKAFWSLVERFLPDYRILKTKTPYSLKASL